jgi:hypothetical protein
MMYGVNGLYLLLLCYSLGMALQQWKIVKAGGGDDREKIQGMVKVLIVFKNEADILPLLFEANIG